MLAFAFLLLEAAPPAVPDVSITIGAQKVEIQATAAPLARVFEVLAEKGSLRVVYDGPAPAQTVTLSVSAPTLRDAITKMLDEQHLRYGFSADDSGRVAAVVVVTRNVVAPPPSVKPEAPRAPVDHRGTRPDPVASVQEPPMEDHPSPPDE